MNDRLQGLSDGRGEPKSGFGGWISGRARRREYFAWLVPLLLLAGALSLTGIPGITLLAGVPLLFAMIRRLHDLGQTGWYAPLINIAANVASYGFVAFMSDAGALAGGLVQLAALGALGCIPGQARANAFGPPPGRKGADLQATFS